MPIKSGSKPLKEDVSPDAVFYLDSGILGGREVKEGDQLTVTVVELGDGEIGVIYPTEEPPATEEDDTMLREAFGPAPM